MTLRLLMEPSAKDHPQPEKETGFSDSTSPQTKPGSVCKAVTKAGKPCRAAATQSGCCYFHANPAKAAELVESAAEDTMAR